MKLSFAELHNPLFLAGTNLGVKLQTNVRNVTLEYYREHHELHVSFNGKTAIVPSSNVASMTPVEESAREDAKPVAAATHQGKIAAQVSTPQSHVFAGLKT